MHDLHLFLQLLWAFLWELHNLGQEMTPPEEGGQRHLLIVTTAINLHVLVARATTRLL